MTSSDYIWDKSGTPQPWVQELERTLGTLRFEPLAGVPLTVQPEARLKVRPSPEPAPRRLWVPLVVGLSTAAAVLLIAAGVSTVREDAGVASSQPRPLETAAPAAPAVAPEVAGTAPSDTSAEANEPEGAAALILEVETTEPAAMVDDAKPARAKREDGREDGRAATSAAKRKSRSKPKSESGVTVDCILDPFKCGNEKLPYRLGSSGIKKGVAKVKVRARLCGKKHGVESGARVKIQLRIKGATGRVTRAKALGSWADTEAGRCVEDELSRAEFPRFSAESMSALYPVTMTGHSPKSDAESGDDPDTKTAAAMSRALAPLRVKAKACGVLHDATKGTRVNVKVWFNGETGAVEASKAMAPHTGGELGKCVASVVRKGKLPRTGKTEETALVPFRM